MADIDPSTSDQQAGISAAQQSQRLQRRVPSRIFRPMVYILALLGALLGAYANPEQWLQSVVLYGFLGFSVGILLGLITGMLEKGKKQL